MAQKRRRALLVSSSSSSSSSSNSGEDEEEEEEEVLSDREIDRREREAERQRRKDPVRRKYLMEAADESDGDDDDDDGEDDGSGGVSDKENNSGGKSSSSESESDNDGEDNPNPLPPSASGEVVQKTRKKKDKEDLSDASAFANMRALHSAMESGGEEDYNSENESEGSGECDEDAGVHDSETDSVPDIELPSDKGVGYLVDDGSGADEELHLPQEKVGAGGWEEGPDVDDGNKSDASDENNSHNKDHREGGVGDDENSNLGGYGDDDNDEDVPDSSSNNNNHLDDSEAQMRRQLYYDPDCCNNLSRSMRIVNLPDVQVDPNTDGYVYCFTSVADGPMLSQMAMKQILVLLHVIFSYVPEECILETEYLKPTFDTKESDGGSGGSGSAGGSSAGLEKLQKKVSMTADESVRADELRRKLASMPLCDMPFNEAFVLGDNDESSGDHTQMRRRRLPSGGLEGDPMSEDDENSAFQRIRNSMMAGRKHTLQIVDVADILVAPVCVTHKRSYSNSMPAAGHKRGRNGESRGSSCLNDDDDDDDEDGGGSVPEKITGFWMVMLKTRKCYNFTSHLHWLVSKVDKKVGFYCAVRMHDLVFTSTLFVIRACTGQEQHEASGDEGVRRRDAAAARGHHVPVRAEPHCSILLPEARTRHAHRPAAATH